MLLLYYCVEYSIAYKNNCIERCYHVSEVYTNVERPNHVFFYIASRIFAICPD